MLSSPEALGEQSTTLYIINCDNTLQNNSVVDSLLALAHIISCALPAHTPPPCANSETNRQFRQVKIPHCSVRNTRSISTCQHDALLSQVALEKGSSDSTLYLQASWGTVVCNFSPRNLTEVTSAMKPGQNAWFGFASVKRITLREGLY